MLQTQKSFDIFAKEVLLLQILMTGPIYMPTRNNCKCFLGLAIRLQGCVSEESWFDTLLGKTYFSTDTPEGA